MRRIFLCFALSFLCANEVQYEFIREVAAKYQRPFTVLDLGAGDGTYSFKLAEDFPGAVCVMVERNQGLSSKHADKLLQECQATQKNIILLDKTITTSDLEHLSKVEHFDIILGMDFLPHLRIPRLFSYNSVISSLLRLGDHVILELPIQSRSYIRHVRESKAIKKTEEHELFHLFLLEGENTVTLREHWFDTSEPYTLKSSFEKKTLTKTLNRPPWTLHFCKNPGISLFTYFILHGKWPDREALKEKVTTISWEHYTNLSPWNILLSGHGIEIEDLNFFAPPKDPTEAKTRMLELFNRNTQKELREL